MILFLKSYVSSYFISCSVVLELVYLKQTEESCCNNQELFCSSTITIFFAGHVNYGLLSIFHTMPETRVRAHTHTQSEIPLIYQQEKMSRLLRRQELCYFASSR